MILTRRRMLPVAAALAATGAAAQPVPSSSQGDDDDPAMVLKLVILDIGGTLVADRGELASTLTATLARHNIPVDAGELNAMRGSSKPDMVHHFVAKTITDNAALMTTSKAIYDAFVRDLSKAYESAQPIPGALEAVRELKSMGLTLAATTGFDRALAIEILHRLQFQAYLSALVAGDDVAQGRPAPFMLFRAMEATGTHDVREVMAVGDTVLDLEAADNAGVGAAIGVYSGAATESRLRQARNSGVLPSVAALPELIKTGLPLSHCR